MSKLQRIIFAFCVAVIGFVVTSRFTGAQSQTDVKPYEFASIPVPFHTVDVKVYKMVHQGCEIYVTTNSAMGHEAASIAIATGRGCK